MKNEGLLDQWADRLTRKIARGSGRRSFLARLAGMSFGVSVLPLLPVSRASAAGPQALEEGDPLSCDYWRHCAIDGYLCGCCGGSVNSCPPGTEISPVSWIGICTNPVDGNNYVISYNDCCGNPRAEDVFAIPTRAINLCTFPRRATTSTGV